MQRTFKDRRHHSNHYTKLHQGGPSSHHPHTAATDAEDLTHQNRIISRTASIIGAIKRDTVKVCQSKARQTSKTKLHSKQDHTNTQHTLQVEEESSNKADSPTYSMFAFSTVTPLTVTMLISGASLEMKVDTGASTSIISETTYRNT